MTSSQRIIIIGGGTFSAVRNHQDLAVRAWGSTARRLKPLFEAEVAAQPELQGMEVELVLTRMADPSSRIETTEDVARLVDAWVLDPTVKAIVFNVAMADFNGQVGDVPSGKYAARLKTSEGPVTMVMTPAEKVIHRIRRERKDIFLVGFKTTADADSDAQYLRALELLKKNSVNLVLANDTVRRNNMIVAPEETRYCETTDRAEVLAFLAKMAVSRMQNTFTRSTVVEGVAVPWQSEAVPANLRAVVDHCIARGAYKPVLGKTAGHFAVKAGPNDVLTSIRKTNFNQLNDIGLVRIEAEGDDKVIAHGFKPSVGGQSQRIIFREHAGLDCIVHFHCPVKADAQDKPLIPVKAQWPNECGSHECGRNTSRGLSEVDLGEGDRLSVVFLDDHGPNIVFNRATPAHKVVAFIERNFDLTAKTGGLVA